MAVARLKWWWWWWCHFWALAADSGIDDDIYILEVETARIFSHYYFYSRPMMSQTDRVKKPCKQVKKIKIKNRRKRNATRLKGTKLCISQKAAVGTLQRACMFSTGIDIGIIKVYLAARIRVCQHYPSGPFLFFLGAGKRVEMAPHSNTTKPCISRDAPQGTFVVLMVCLPTLPLGFVSGFSRGREASWDGPASNYYETLDLKGCTRGNSRSNNI